MLPGVSTHSMLTLVLQRSSP
ncbi:unnamed protein product [Linum tenue]|uniref:Uncharacterized protein n=2 Tax=Linum tenue TaxID=586396 RepID=A0AAV0KMD0_9ROSI|nr:unnamed protein product [Linum tenue]